MSEYQVHEWQAVDRVLTPEEQAAVNDLSSHIDVTPSRAVVTYNWSSFRHDPKQVLLQYFDAYFYLANWGTLELMFRFPKGLLDQADVEPYCLNECVTLDTLGNYHVLDLGFGPDAIDGWMAGDADLSHFVRPGALLPPEPPRPAGQRTVDQLLQRAEQLQQAEEERRAQLAREKHVAEIQALAGREKQVWRQVETLLDTGPKTAPVYDQATALLIKLEQLSQFQHTQAAFAAHLRQLAQQYSSRPALIGRWQKRGWI